MIHKFVANDNKGNVNVLEVTSTGTKLGKVAPPVEDTDAATKKYVDDNAGGGSSLPPVTSADNGKVLAVEDGAWAASEQGKKFIVTLTPTDLDYSGTMDKTPAEISAAYEDGMEIVFRVVGVPDYDYVDVKATEAILWTDNHLWQMSAYLIMLPDMLIYFYNSRGEATYATQVYSLTPAS